jgi:anti-sigma factor RsiW
MSDARPPVDEDDLHAYLDGQLPAERRLDVERHLAKNPDAARKIADYRAQREAIRAAFTARPTEPLPPELSLARIIAQRGRRPWRSWRIAASVVVALGLGLAGGWFLHRVPPPGVPERGAAQRAMALLGQEALASHAVYAVDVRHPVEVSGSEAPHLQQWLSNRLDRTVVVPDLSVLGYRLIGGRLLATERGGAAALLMYDDARHQRISLLLRPMTRSLKAPKDMLRQDGVNGCAWIADGLGVAVVAAIPESDIERIVTQIGADFPTSG